MNEFASDPTTAPDMVDSPETSWPKVIGVISIIYAICGLGCQVLGLGSALMSEWLMSMGGMDVTMPSMMKITTAVSAVLMTCLGFLMLAGGIALVRRRPAGVSRLRTWALLRVIMIVVGVAIAVLTLPAQIEFQRSIQEATNDMLRENGQTAAITEFDENASWTQVVVMTGVMSGVLAIYPLFIGFYLSRQKIRDEVATWY